MHAITLYDAYIRRIAALLAGVTALAVFLYGGLLLGAVAHTAGRTAAEKQVQHLSATISTLESAYLTETKALSAERAIALGFVMPTNMSTVYAGAGALTLR